MINAALKMLGIGVRGVGAKNIAKGLLGYGLIQATSSLADEADKGSVLGFKANIGGFWTGAAKFGSYAIGGGMLLGGATGAAGGLLKNIGRNSGRVRAGVEGVTTAIERDILSAETNAQRAINLSFNPSNRRFGRSQKLTMAAERYERTARRLKLLNNPDRIRERLARHTISYGLGRKIQGYNTKWALRTIGGIAGWAAKEVGKAGTGLITAPLMPVADTINIGRRLAGNRFNTPGVFGKAMNWFGERTGARAIGWGSLVGAGALAINVSNEAYEDKAAGRGMALQGQQFYDPISGMGPRRSQPNDNTDGLVQAMHLLR